MFRKTAAKGEKQSISKTGLERLPKRSPKVSSSEAASKQPGNSDNAKAALGELKGKKSSLSTASRSQSSKAPLAAANLNDATEGSQRGTSTPLKARKQPDGQVLKEAAPLGPNSRALKPSTAPKHPKLPSNSAAKPLSTIVEVNGRERDESGSMAQQTVEFVKPVNQVQLSSDQLAEEIPRNLSAGRPAPPKLLVRYNLEDRGFKQEAGQEPVMVHYSSPGLLVAKASEEGQKEVMLQAAAREARASSSGEAPVAANEKRLRNQFNFCERGMQTPFFGKRDRMLLTETPPVAEAGGECSPWAIFDAYISGDRQQIQQAELPETKKAGIIGEELLQMEPNMGAADELQSACMAAALKALERMSSHNTCKDTALDFKYWEDEADSIRIDEGTLLPLWKFSSDSARNKQATAVAWSSAHPDLFVVGYGSFDFQRQVSGLVAGFSLKNPSFPEFSFATKSGVMSLALHPQHPQLLAVGCYDGSVAVHDARGSQKPLCRSQATCGGHMYPVWGIVWRPLEPRGPTAFYSLSSDGRLLLWTMARGQLSCQEAIRLDEHKHLGLKPDEESSRSSLAAGCSIDFHPVDDFIFLVGTEEGSLYKCSIAHRSDFLLKYAGHDMSVYAVQWNHIHTTTFISSSADWTVKIWHTDEAAAMMSFTLGTPVGDVAWSPNSASVFATVTDDGLVRIYDLDQNAEEPLCEQKVVAKSALTRLAFSPRYPLLVVGDDRGNALTLKLSPNLRKCLKVESGSARLEVEKLDKVLCVARKQNDAIGRALEQARIG